ncbi:hypothetical protein TIFTF001_017874 [Ficus carica]|uniref:GH10 domain-containing protein n=1 Tax=Ficus carica TaxID=3494 RepID=A0AA88ARD8_FICCA|nr:hypothetical protein TIFTF001_017874 [Ficus carica]
MPISLVSSRHARVQVSEPMTNPSNTRLDQHIESFMTCRPNILNLLKDTAMCKAKPEGPLYRGGILRGKRPASVGGSSSNGNISDSGRSWVKIEGASSALIRASLKTENETYNCIGNVLARPGCWSFIKGGFTLNSPSNFSILYFENSDDREVNIAVASTSLQPFSDQQWRTNQQYIINTKRKRAVTVHVSNVQGERLQGAAVTIEQLSKDFPFGSAIAKTILGNLPYQNWFVKRFNAAVFENELKWYATEPKQGEVNYTIPDKMLEFVRANQIIARGHNIFWEDPQYTPAWVRNLSSTDLQLAAVYLEQVLREGFSHPYANGIMLWTALHPNGCYRMCLTDNNFQNLPAGDVVDKLLKEWKTEEFRGCDR